jgi:hypothetical protein
VDTINRYSGDDPARLASEIEMALRAYGRNGERRLLTAIDFFEGELALIARALRSYAAENKNEAAQ